MGVRLLEADGLTVAYGPVRALREAHVHLDAGETVAVIGANGAGKTSLLRALMGLGDMAGGRVRLRGADITALPPWRRAQLGMRLVPEGGRVFRDLTVEQNLRMGAYLGRVGRAELAARAEQVVRLFPVLGQRRAQRAKTLSGGEQQMLAIARALMAFPAVLMIDEVSLGLMPVLVNQVFDTLAELKRRRVSMLIVEQNARKALALADRAYVLENGSVVLQGRSDELRADPRVVAAYLGGAAAGA